MHVINTEARLIKVWTTDIEAEAMTQLRQLAALPFIHPNGVVAMPDVHAGIGSTVGSVIVTDKAIIPAAVGVDIGCGMVAVKTSLKASDLPESLSALRSQIERDIPVGFNQYTRSEDIDDNWHEQYELFSRFRKVVDSTPGLSVGKYEAQLGTLGGGNHFIEVCLDEDQAVWVMLHSGSRGIGNQIGRYYIDKAKELCARWHVELPHNDLAYLPDGEPLLVDYVRAVGWAQDYALTNRAVMLRRTLAAMTRKIDVPFTVDAEAINCHHNYVELENHYGRNMYVTRKGAIRAREGDLGIIPGSMGQRSYIVKGKGNKESYCSCSHGAGRAMSRTEAKKRFSLTDLIEQTKGVECRKDADVIDEIPGSYKDIDVVMKNQEDLVEVVSTLKAVLCVKG
jgi:tRNA-splicing ligase RtcB (3'-phosphate/5'-hydroxy nucleic acid ligase)